MSRPFAIVATLILLSIAAVAAYNWTRTGAPNGVGFSDADITGIEQAIIVDFRKRPGVTVEQVEMLRQTPRQLTGFAKLKLPLIGEVNKSCTATMGDDGRAMWQCK